MEEMIFCFIIHKRDEKVQFHPFSTCTFTLKCEIKLERGELIFVQDLKFSNHPKHELKLATFNQNTI